VTDVGKIPPSIGTLSYLPLTDGTEYKTTTETTEYRTKIINVKSEHQGRKQIIKKRRYNVKK
jgi:hypothetical protein